MNRGGARLSLYWFWGACLCLCSLRLVAWDVSFLRFLSPVTLADYELPEADLNVDPVIPANPYPSPGQAPLSIRGNTNTQAAEPKSQQAAESSHNQSESRSDNNTFQQTNIIPQGRQLRFPSVSDRLLRYLGNDWSLDRGPEAPVWRYARVDPNLVKLYPPSENHVIKVPTKLSLDAPFVVDMVAARWQLRELVTNRSVAATQQYFFNAVNSIFYGVDLQEWKYNRNAVPIFANMASPDAMEVSSIVRYPQWTWARRRDTNATESNTATAHRAGTDKVGNEPTPTSPPPQPILWNPFSSLRHRKQIMDSTTNTDVDWLQKQNEALLTQSCLSKPKCQSLATALSIPSNIPHLLLTAAPRKGYRSKVLVLLPALDREELVRALLSQSVVLMPVPVTTSWLMEDQLEPWVHYVPLAADLSNLEGQMKWVWANDHAARRIAERATVWIHDLYFHENATKDNEYLQREILRRYKALFQPLTVSSDSTVGNDPIVKPRMSAPTIFTAGGQSASEIIAASRRVKADPQSNITGSATLKTAVCYKTLFGAVDLERFTQWVAYNHLLGFDHVFAWYLPGLRDYDGFDTLANLPYVTLLENKDDTILTEINPGYEILHGSGDQRAVERLCLRETAKDYDWVMFADADEYLWFHENIGLKEFIHRYGGNNTYLSFGKKMYTRTHSVDDRDSGFGLDMYPFNAGPFCSVPPDTKGSSWSALRTKYSLSNPVCPMHFGRSKVIVQPRAHDHVSVHGNHYPDPDRKSIHYSVHVAHFKEWPKLFDEVDTRLQGRMNFTVFRNESLSIHDLKSGHQSNADGSYNMFYDDQLHDWFEFVAQHADTSILK